MGLKQLLFLVIGWAARIWRRSVSPLRLFTWGTSWIIGYI